MLTRHPKYLVAAIILSAIFSPFAETSGQESIIPDDNIHLVDPRLELVFLNPERSQELGIAPAPVGKISLKVGSPSYRRPRHERFRRIGRGQYGRVFRLSRKHFQKEIITLQKIKAKIVKKTFHAKNQ